MDCFHDMTNVRRLCIICLAEGGKNISLESSFQRKRTDSPSILWVLEMVMSMKLKFNGNYPTEICTTCLNLLNISYDLRKQFQNSQTVLKEHITRCLEDMEENNDNTVSPQELTAFEDNDLLTPKLEVNVEESTCTENNENVEYVYEDNIEELEEYLHLKTEQENTEQLEEDSGFNQTEYVEESNELSDKINKLIQINATSYRVNKELQIKQLDVDKYIIEKPLKSSGINLTTDHDVNLSSLDEELIQAAYNLKYECPGCPKFYSSLRKLSRHQEICIKFKHFVESQSRPITFTPGNRNVDDRFEEYECDRCLKYYHSSDKLEQHKESVHSESKLNIYEEFKLEDLSELDQELFKGALLLKYECDTCRKVYSSPDKLEKHKASCEKLKRKPPGKSKANAKIAWTQPGDEEVSLDVYNCEICGHISTSKKNDLYHKQAAHGEKKYACEKCGKVFGMNSILKQHMQSHAKGETKVVCPICGKGFHYNSGLFYHMKMHRKELNYLCDYCNKRFINMNALKRHLATHTGERAYKCRMCVKKFKGSSELRMHELRHTGSRPHLCNYCGKGHTSKSNLQFHIITHSGNVPCSLCERDFLNADVLQLHMKIKHKVKKEDPLFTS